MLSHFQESQHPGPLPKPSLGEEAVPMWHEALVQAFDHRCCGFSYRKPLAHATEKSRELPYLLCVA